jgi:hypothetical protein
MLVYDLIDEMDVNMLKQHNGLWYPRLVARAPKP